MTSSARRRLAGRFWEAHGYYTAARRYRGQSKPRAFLSALLFGWHDIRRQP
jgi:hypothetical protein